MIIIAGSIPVDRSKDAELLAAHAKSAHLADFRSKIAGLVTGQPNINKFDASNKGPLR